jgi:hypothetical protein
VRRNKVVRKTRATRPRGSVASSGNGAESSVKSQKNVGCKEPSTLPDGLEDTLLALSYEQASMAVYILTSQGKVAVPAYFNKDETQTIVGKFLTPEQFKNLCQRSEILGFDVYDLFGDFVNAMVDQADNE